ncbi:E3 ubiquitin-protein ligase UBR2 isoform X1 [Euwallacea similis]|uniref:E3 ubiquitin-protein ligase UBR2 isoform X1 n=2 Tax=Euwallacea similis TaxID=1736056 RepID=UPI00344C471E
MYTHPLGKIPPMPADFESELKNKLILKKKMDDTTDVEMSQEHPPSQGIVAEWLAAFDNGTFSGSSIDKFWDVFVPKVYCPTLNDSCLSWQFDENMAQDLLFGPLATFICKGNSEEILPQITQAKSYPSVCGRFFKNGEPTYSCRECGMDKTCVLCVDCFKNSSHRFHKYRMGASGGGGCCDCGDVEAWKRDPFCSAHQVNSSINDDGKGDLPADVVERARLVFRHVMWSTFDRLANVGGWEGGGVVSELFIAFDIYCTILYNDEVHTFEQVINTLSRVLKCNHRSSTEFVTNIDREGRAVVKCASFQTCRELQHDIEKYTSRNGSKPLKVHVTHAYVVAHQIFSQKLLAWLEKFLANGRGFRAVFSDCIQEIHPKHKQSLLSQIMVKDSTLWKSARTQLHRLLIAGMLLEYENKRTLAKVFTKNYGQIMKDYIRDDHEHSYSISSISVQLFTVPTLAHHLIANDDVLYHLLNTLISEYQPKCNRDGKLEFERNPSYHSSFKRSLVMLFDLKYLLTSVPSSWSDDLKKNFLHGFKLLVDLLVMMQGMDAVTRQVGQHMEFEPEWESGFNLYIKIAHCISHVITWCATDKVVLVKAYRSLLKTLDENPCYDPNRAGEVRELADHSTACLYYDVSSKPVSIHLPLSRLLAALHLHLEKFGLHFDSPELQQSKPTPVQIIEPVLRAQVMIAQVHAGMWRRNGYALLNTLYFYHNVKCRSEMLDRDITLLQIGASLIESNEFLIHILNKFSLINWALADFEITSLKSSEEDSMRQTINLVEEFLYLMIVIIGERHMPGVSQVTNKDRIKKDILHALCIKQAPHSELIKCVSDDLEDEDGDFETVIHEIAKFNKPSKSTSSKGTYELLPQYFNEFNVFFYHYTREEMSKAEEEQRKRRKTNSEIECCPPPNLPKLCESFSLLVNMLQCDVMLHIIQTIMERGLNLRARSFSENQFHKVLHLVGYGLQEEESGHYPFFKFIEKASKFRIFQLMEEMLKSCRRIDSHKGLLQWTLQKYHQMIKKIPEDAEMEKPRSSSDNPDDLTEKERRAKLAAEKRAKIMAQMAAQQKSFIKENAKMFENINVGVEAEQAEEISNDSMEVTESHTVALGPNQSTRVACENTYRCILCQEGERITAKDSSMVLAAFVHQATVLNKQPKDFHQNSEPKNNNPLFLSSIISPSPHTSTCGHVMHSDCWGKFFDNVMVREHRRPYRLRHPSSFDVDKQEFLCPLCECLSNTVLPVVPSLSKLQPSTRESELTFREFIDNLKFIISKTNKVCHGIIKCNLVEECTNLHCVPCMEASNATGNKTEPEQELAEECEVNCILQPYQVFFATIVDKTNKHLSKDFIDLFRTSDVELNVQMQEMIQIFGQFTYTRGLNVPPHPSDKRVIPMVWKSLAYTTHAIETVTDYQMKPLLGSLTSRHRDSLENLVRVVALFGKTWGKNDLVKSHALNLLSILLQNPQDDASILDFDPFGFLVSLTFALPSLLVEDTETSIPTASVLEWHLLRLMFVLNIVQCLLNSNPDSWKVSDGSATSDETLDSLLMAIFKRQLGGQICAYKVWESVKEASRSFLRCCVLFYHYLTEVPAPNCLQETGGDTFENMCAYLDMPTSPRELLGSEIVQQLVQKWINHPEVMQHTPPQCLPGPPRLVDLPEDYSELINAVSTFTCPNNGEECRNPTMCLVCGEVLCSQSYCCQTEFKKIPVGACNGHASICGAGVGIFLRIRDCELLLLATPHRGCFMPPPYLDEHGETDQGLRRGNPLRLNKERYDKLHMMWLNHSIHEEIARQIETSNHIVATTWNML